jgi:hypothetical protein
MLISIGLVATLLIVQTSYADALTKEEATAQRMERERALAQIQTNNGTSIESFKPYLNVITLEISKACKASNSTKCPSFAQLISLDNTNQKYVGSLTNEKRLKPLLKNPSIIYKDVKETIICLDCPWDIYKNAKHIMIDRPFIYKLNDDRVITNNTRYEYHNRYVSEGCNNARLAWLPGYLDDTIRFIKSGCTETEIQEKITIKTEFTKHDISTSKAYKYQKWLQEAKKLKTINCIKSNLC